MTMKPDNNRPYEAPRVEDLGTLESLTAARGTGVKEGVNNRSV